MFDVAELPHELQELIWTAYREGLRTRRAEYFIRTNRVILEHIRTLCQSDDAFNRILDWMAHMLQHPQVKPPKAIVLLGPEGSGPTLVATVLARLLGPDRMLTTHTLGEGLSPALEGKTLVHLDGCDLRNELAQIHTLLSCAQSVQPPPPFP